MFKSSLAILRKHARRTAGCDSLPGIINADWKLMSGRVLVRNCFLAKETGSKTYGGLCMAQRRFAIRIKYIIVIIKGIVSLYISMILSLSISLYSVGVADIAVSRHERNILKSWLMYDTLWISQFLHFRLTDLSRFTGGFVTRTPWGNFSGSPARATQCASTLGSPSTKDPPRPAALVSTPTYIPSKSFAASLAYARARISSSPILVPVARWWRVIIPVDSPRYPHENVGKAIVWPLRARRA